MRELSRSDDGSSTNGRASAVRIETLRIAPSDTLFRPLVYCENLRCYCIVAFTRTHFAWAPRSFLLASFEALFPAKTFTAVEWRAVETVELEFRRPDREKLIRIAWTADKGEIGGLEMTRIGAFDYWGAQFRKVGFMPVGGNPFRASFRGLLCDYGPTVWVIVWAIIGFSLLIFGGPYLAIVFPAFFTILGVPLWFLAERKARHWFPPGWRQVLERFPIEGENMARDGL